MNIFRLTSIGITAAVPDQFLKAIGYMNFRNDSRASIRKLFLEGHYESSAYFMASIIGTLRKNLSAGGLCEIIRGQFQNIPDTLMAAFAMFQFKCPSLLQLDKASRDVEDEIMIGNLKRLYNLGGGQWHSLSEKSHSLNI